MYKEINEFLQSKAIAIAGVSRKNGSFSQILLKAFIKKGYRVYALNPNINEIDGVKVYPSIMELPDDVEAIYIIKRKDLAVDLARDAVNKGIRKIWIHVKCSSPELELLSKDYGISIIAGECFFMWAEPVKGIHAFHRFLRRVFDKSFR